MVKAQCSECGKTFGSQCSLIRHNRELHQKKKVQRFICFYCEKMFPRKQNLTMHIQTAHSNYMKHENFDDSQPKFICPECGRELARKATLMKHIEKQHAVRDEPSPANPKSQTCVKCNKDFVNELFILKHIENDHGIPLKRETVSFESWENFVRWKEEIETTTFCRYVKRTTTKLKFEDVVYYYCERRGFHLPPGQRKRREWSHGSKKINGYCPAKIIVRKNLMNGNIKASYCSSHMHSIEPENLKYSRFSDNIKNEVAQKLVAQVPIERILKEVRTSKSKAFLEKSQIMTRKDILNIARSTNVRNLNRKSIKPAVEIETFTEKHSEAILLYKKEGEILENCPDLLPEDFVLIYMNQKQKEYFQRSGNNILSTAETYGLDEFGFVLHTLMVLDDFDQGYPACFLFTNRNDETVSEILFQYIKQEIGPLKVYTFMSDMQEKFFNAYLKVMEHKPNFYLFCSWRVRKEWKRNLAKIKDVEKKKETENKLCFLQESTDIPVFEQELTEFCGNTDPDLADFMEYFRINFMNNTKQWAYCYRQYSGINTSLVVRNFHRQIKHTYENGSRITRLQDGLAFIESYLERREQNDLIFNIKGHVPQKVAKLRKAHDEAKKHLDSGVSIRRGDDDTSWVVESFSSSFIEYVVTSCGDCVPDCKLMCENCFCCIHMFKCTCRENSIKNIMCKHIHAVCLQQVLEQEVVKVLDSESEMMVEDDISVSSPFAIYQLTDEEAEAQSNVQYEDESKLNSMHYIDEASEGQLLDVSQKDEKHFDGIVAAVASSPMKNSQVEYEEEFSVESEAQLLDFSEQSKKLFKNIMAVVGSCPKKNKFVIKALEDLEAAVFAMGDHESESDDCGAEEIIIS